MPLRMEGEEARDQGDGLLRISRGVHLVIVEPRLAHALVEALAREPAGPPLEGLGEGS